MNVELTPETREGLEPNTPPWMLDAACRGRDPNEFHPESHEWEAQRRALAICNGRPGTLLDEPTPPCPVRAECLEFAIVNGMEFGIWGGTNMSERRKIRRAYRAQR